MWQELIVGICVFTALLFVIYRYWPNSKKSGGCDGCSGCGSKSSCADKLK